MPAGYWISVTVHVFAALLWLGGMFFFALVGAPVLRGVEPAALRAELFRRLGERFRTVGWMAVAVLVATGVLNLHYRGLLRVMDSPVFWGSRTGHALAWKLTAVGLMIVISLVHDFILGPAASRTVPGSPGAIRARARAAWLARINAIVGIVLVIAAVRLARGG